MELQYPLKDVAHVKEMHSPGKEETSVRPLIKTETVDGGLGGPPERTREEVAQENPSGIAADGNQVWVTEAWMGWRGRASIRSPGCLRVINSNLCQNYSFRNCKC